MGERVLETRGPHRLPGLVLLVDICLPSHHSDGRSLFVADHLTAGEHPSVVTVLHLHPIALFDDGDLARDAGIDDRPESSQVIGVHAAQPGLQGVLEVVGFVTEHPFPAVGKMDGLRRQVEVPDAIAEATSGEQKAVVFQLQAALKTAHLVEFAVPRLDEAESGVELLADQRQHDEVVDAEFQDRRQLRRIARRQQRQGGTNPGGFRFRQRFGELGGVLVTHPPVDDDQLRCGPPHRIPCGPGAVHSRAAVSPFNQRRFELVLEPAVAGADNGSAPCLSVPLDGGGRLRVLSPPTDPRQNVKQTHHPSLSAGLEGRVKILMNRTAHKSCRFSYLIQSITVVNRFWLMRWDGIRQRTNRGCECRRESEPLCPPLTVPRRRHLPRHPVSTVKSRVIADYCDRPYGQGGSR